LTTLLDLKRMAISKEALNKVSSRVATHYNIMPLSLEGDRLKICVPTDFDMSLKEELNIVLNKELEICFSQRELILEAIRAHYGLADDMIAKLSAEHGNASVLDSYEVGEELHSQEDASIKKLVNELILDALDHRATDIHLEPFEERFVIRYRIDGLLKEARISKKIRPLSQNIISRIKIMARLDIGEKRLPQDGRIKVKTGKKELDLRVSVLPTSCGEAIVIRILGSANLLNLDTLGFSNETVFEIRQAMKKSHGIVLLTGPTGSGKTTTLYSILKEINTGEKKIITIEDPVEYKMSGILQMQVKPLIDFTFAAALRSMLRHDPDILMVGEIRDPETAEIAIRSALTGHLFFSTLHTNDAASALTRLMEMGVAPYLVASTVEIVIAQRLVRMLCDSCKRKEGTTGCNECQGSGFRGRQAIEELLKVDEDVKKLVLSGASSNMIKDLMCQKKALLLKDRGVAKATQGLTTLEEIERVC